MTFICSCDLLDSGGPEAAFLKMEDPVILVNPDQGANTSNISDAWVFANGASIGVYFIPAKVPVILEADPTEIVIFPGIRLNGISSAPAINPFYKSLEFSDSYTPGVEVQIPLEFAYKTETVFELLENFEGNHLFTFDEDGNPETTLTTTTDEFRSGARSGLLEVSESDPILESASFFVFDSDVVQNGPVFLEMDYKNTVDILVGLIGVEGITSFKNYKLGLRPSEEWNKVYIDFTEDISQSQLEGYRVVFGLNYDSSKAESIAYIDNIKLLHF